jgi:hypothetical protein
MSDMMDDINKYAAIWDAAQEKGIFKDAPKPPQPRNQDAEDSFFGADFFGQNRSAEYDIDEPINEVDSKYWATLSRMADPLSHYVDPLMTEESVPSKENTKNAAEKMAGSHNPIHPNSVGKDQDMQVTQNWGVGGKEHFQLEDLKVRLEKLESKLNGIESKGDSGKSTQDKIDGLKKQIDELSDSLNGDRFSFDG